MSNKYIYSFVMMGIIAVFLFLGTYVYIQNTEAEEANDEVMVVTSFYPMYVLTQNLLDGIKEVTLTNLSEPQTGCLHDFQLTPEDMILLSKAQVLIVNGSGAESFLTDVYKQYEDLQVIDATKKIAGEEEMLAHAWMSPEYYHEQIDTVASEFLSYYPQFSDEIMANKKRYLDKVKALEDEVLQLQELTKNHPVILLSEAFEVLAEELSLNCVYLMDLDEERQISSGEVKDVLMAADEYEDCVIIAERRYGTNMAELVQKQCNIPVLYLEPLTRGEYKMDAYIEGMQRNLDIVKENLTQ